MMLFCRRLKRASRRIGANLRLISIVASVALPSGSSSIFTTLPTFTPAIRTSAGATRLVASVMATLNW